VSERPGRVEQPGPVEMRDPLVRHELKRAGIWLILIGGAALVVLVAQPLLLILAGIVFASMLDGGTRLLGRVLPIGRGWRLAIVMLLVLAFLVGTVWLAGVQLAQQASEFRELVTSQFDRLMRLLDAYGITPGSADAQSLVNQAMSGLGRLTSALTSVFGALASLLLVIVTGLFIAMEPRIYERGIAWMLPLSARDSFYRTSAAMGSTLRRLMAGRLLGMAVEGFATWILLTIGGVPIAALLGLLTGLLAFIPNIGAIISGVMIVLVGFSVSFEVGLWAVGVYCVVQFVDGYLVVPYVARKTVDLAPALVLGAQLIFGALFGILGLMLADPIVAMVKAALEQRSIDQEAKAEARAKPPPIDGK
jgi:predicted PurR-regulated permease PerM